MKKLNYLLPSLALVALASCSQEEIVNSTFTGEGNYHVTVTLPTQMATRAMNDGKTANTLLYTVYDIDNNNEIVDYGTAQFGTDAAGALSTVVNLNLANGIEYAISFFAQSQASLESEVYNYNRENGTITVDYSKMVNADFQNDSYDCFVNLLNTGKIGSNNVSTNVILYRPMAQINWGTNDLHAVNADTGLATNNVAAMVEKYFGTPKNNSVNYPLPYIQSTLTTKAYDTFNILDNDVDTSLDPVTVTLADFTQPVQANGQLVGFPVTGYRYVASNYLLAPQKNGTLYDLNLNINNGNVTSDSQSASLSVNYDVEVPSAPVQANFKTNIYGSLLTDNVQITVTKSQYWAGTNNLPQDEYEMGAAVEGTDGLYFNADLNIYTITSTDGLEFLANNIALSSSITVVLAEDLNMDGVEHKPFSLNSATFNGGNHTISNLTVNTSDQGNASAGFFSSAIGYVQNLHFTDATITGNYKVGVVAGDGLCAHFDNCSVTGATVTSNPWKKDGSLYDDGNNCGGIVGYLSAEPSASITNCSVSGATITAYRKVGGLVGYASGGSGMFITNNEVSNTTVIANQYIEDGEYDGAPKEYAAGEILGQLASTAATFSNNEPLNVVVKTVSPEGVASTNVASTGALQSAISEAAEGETIHVAAGSYTFPAVSNFKNPDIILDCEDGVVFDGATTFGAYGINGATVKNATFSNLTGNALGGYLDGNFVDCVFEGSNGTRYTYLSGNTTFTGCTFKGTGVYAFHVDSAVNHNYPGEEISMVFTDCYFDGFVAMGGSVPELTYNSCTFVINSSSKYGGGNFYGTTTFNECKFFLPQPKKSFQYIALATAGKVFTFNNCTNNGELITVDFDFNAVAGVIVDCDGTSKTFE